MRLSLAALAIAILVAIASAFFQSAWNESNQLPHHSPHRLAALGLGPC